MWNLTDVGTWLWGMLTAPLAILMELLVLLGLLGGCSAEGASIEEQAAGVERTMRYIDKAADIAAKQGLAFTATLDVSGKPAIGQDFSLYFNSGVKARLIFSANAKGAGDGG